MPAGASSGSCNRSNVLRTPAPRGSRAPAPRALRCCPRLLALPHPARYSRPSFSRPSPVPLRARPLPQPTAHASDAAERDWVVRIRLGDENAFESLFEAYYPSLCDFVQSYLHSAESAEEVVQTVFLRIWEQRATWEPTTGVRAYLFAPCRNQALGILKHERVVVRTATRATREEFALGMGRGAPAPDAELHAAELATALRQAVHALPERRRMVVVLRWQHQMSYAEIASVLGISVVAVSLKKKRAPTPRANHVAHRNMKEVISARIEGRAVGLTSRSALVPRYRAQQG